MICWTSFVVYIHKLLEYKTYKRIPQSKLIILKDAGYLMFIDSKDKFFSIIRSFLKNDNAVKTLIPAEIEEELKSMALN